jgi:hypothetical protein
LGAGPKQAELTSKRQTKKRLNFNLLFLCLEGLAHGLSRLLQAKDHSFLLLDGLALICEGDAQLGQLPIKPQNFLVPCDNPPKKIPYYHLKPIYFGH